MRTVAAGSLPANPWGLHEMHGNVWEWCEDRYEKSYDLTPKDGTAHAVGGSFYRVFRGGSFGNRGSWGRSAYRFWATPDSLSDRSQGFRPAADLPK
jgi:formylglycine-generating enzyme required for sulfatase activity